MIAKITATHADAIAIAIAKKMKDADAVADAIKKIILKSSINQKK